MSDDCIFCKIVSGDLGATVVRESEHTLAFRDINAQAPTHVLVVPREHLPTAADLAGRPELLAEVVAEAAAVAAAESVADEGYRLVFNTGARAGQTVFHVHLHVLGGRDLRWPPG